MEAYTQPSTLRRSSSRYLFDQVPPHPHLLVSVIVPVRNEAHHLVETLDALRRQCDNDGRPLDTTLYEVLLLANNCTDASYDIAQAYARQHPTFALHVTAVQLPPKQANIGTVRRLLMDEACRRLTTAGNAATGVIASTDGDTVVDSQWLCHTLREIRNGSDAVGGRILTQPVHSRVRLFHLRDVMYRTLIAKAEAMLDPCPHDPWPRHFQHFGASFAVTCRVYEQVGGLPRKPYLEDEAFYRALLRRDLKIRKSPHVKVYTSTRQQGRVGKGFSEQLRNWANLSRAKTKCQMAEPPEAVLLRFRCRQQLRAWWHTRHQATNGADVLTDIANDLLIEPQFLRREARKCLFFGHLWEKVEKRMGAGRWAEHWQPVPITEAIQKMRQYVGTM